MSNIRDLINSSIEKNSDRNAFTIKHKKGKEVTYEYVTYKRLGEEINALGTALIDLGLKNKRVAIIGKNRYEWMLSYLAVVNGTGIVVPLDKGLPEQEIISSLERSKADAVIYEESFSEIMEHAKKSNNVLVKHYIKMEELGPLIEKGKELIKSGDRRFIDAEIDENAMSIILFTSGTTSLAKAVMLSHNNIASNTEALTRGYDFRNTDVNIAFLPLHHTFGCGGMLLCLSNGANNVFCDGLRHIQENLKEYKVTVFIAVPLILEAMHKKIMKAVEEKGKMKTVRTGIKISRVLLKCKIDIRRKLFKEIINELGGGIRLVITGAAPLTPEVNQDFNDMGICVMHGYGLTETSPVIAGGLPNQPKASSGRMLDNVKVKIDEPNEQGIGEIATKGPNVMLGYYEDEKATNEVLKNGWFYTGDLGYVDKDGYLYIVGRKKSMIVLKNGKKIYPEELEVLIDRLPYVAESMVFGYPKDDGDVILSAKIVYNKNYINEKFPDLSKDEIKNMIWKDIKEINNTLTNYKHIKKIIVTDEEMIKTTTAKVKRFAEMEKILKEEKV